MKICVLTDFYPPKRGGYASHTYEIVKHWIKAGIEVTVVTTVISEQGYEIYNKEIRNNVYRVRKKGAGYLNALRVYARFMRIVFSQKPDLLFFTTWDPYTVFKPLFSFLWSSKYPYIIACHGADMLALYPGSSYGAKPIFKWLGRIALRQAKAIFAVSHYTAREVENLGVKTANIKIFPNGVDYRIFRPFPVDKKKLLSKYGIPGSDRKLLLTVAQLNIRKGLDTALKVVWELKKQDQIVNYIIIGSGDDEQRLNNLIHQLDLEEQVFILSNIDNDELIQFYNICDVFLLLSRHEGDMNVEGFGIVFLEANACEKAVIAGNSGGIPDAVDDGKSGFLVDSNNINEIKEKILNLLENPEISREMGKSGRQRVIEEFNWEKIASDMIRCMEGLIS